MAQLKRTLGLAEVLFFGTGSILGAGIYTIIGKVAGESGNMIWVSFLLASLTAFMTALSYAELSSRFPKAGGEYVYVKEIFNQRIAFILACFIAFSGMISGATVSIAFAGYLSKFLNSAQFISSAAIVALVFLVNATGIRHSSRMNIVFTLIEVSGLALIIYLALPYFGKANLLEMPSDGFHSIILASALSYFAFIGFEEIVKLSEETVKPEKNIPRALLYASAIVAVVYQLVAISAISVIPWQELGKSKHPLSDIASIKLGNTGSMIIAAIALFATTNTILSNMNGSARILLEMGKSSGVLKKLSYIHPKRKTPLVGLLLTAIVMVLFAAIGKIETVALIANLSIFITFLFVNSALIQFRLSEKEKAKFTVPLSAGKIPLTAVLGIVLTMVLFGYSVYGLIEGT